MKYIEVEYNGKIVECDCRFASVEDRDVGIRKHWVLTYLRVSTTMSRMGTRLRSDFPDIFEQIDQIMAEHVSELLAKRDEYLMNQLE